MSDILHQIFEKAKPWLDTRENELHTRVAFQCALRIMEHEQGNPDIVLPAITLHDIGWKLIPAELHLKAFGPNENDEELKRRHEIEGAAMAREILEELQYDPALTTEIVSIITEHDTRLEPISDSDAIVKDADKLWRYSPEALVIDPKRFQVKTWSHVAWLERRIDEWFLTDTAKKLARHEHHLRSLTYGPLPSIEAT